MGGGSNLTSSLMLAWVLGFPEKGGLIFKFGTTHGKVEMETQETVQLKCVFVSCINHETLDLARIQNL
jgi:hypothetical protein